MEQSSVVEKGKTLWHAIDSAEALRLMESGNEGLSQQTVLARRETYGLNRFPEQAPPGLLQILINQFINPLIYILLAAAMVSVLIGEYGDAGFIFAVLTLNACIGAYQELKAERSSAALKNMLKIYARVRRAGSELQIAAEELVPGDIVLLESGVKVPADMRLLSTVGLLVDESLLTGESLAIEKNTAPQAPQSSLGDRRNMVFAGSTVTSGRGTGVVVDTGLQTELGKIASAVTTSESSKPPIIIRMEKFSHQISFIVLGVCLVLGIFEVIQGKPLQEVFLIMVALAVSAIPEGLPIAMTVALSVATQRMAQRNVIVRKLTAVEGLGSCTCIASDKTGTLTVNKQTVQRLFLYPDVHLRVSGEGYNDQGEVLNLDGSRFSDSLQDELDELARTGVLCNEATLKQQQSEWVSSGDAVDIAFLALGYKVGQTPASAAQGLELLSAVPFESERKYAAQFFRQSGKVWVAVKGAAEAIAPMCSCDWDRNRVCGAFDPQKVDQETLRLSEEGYRVLALAVGEVASKADDAYDETDIRGLAFLGLVGLNDPLRPEAKHSIEICHRAGVEVVMITGDHPATAFAIGKELGIADSRDQLASGADWTQIMQLPEQERWQRVRQFKVFARVAPLQKLEIVDALMKSGHFVAVTGDGANDAPALRRANIGVAMGSGTDLAKENADIIVIDDNFSSIVAGVEEGRFAYANVRKVIWFLISNGLGLIVFFTFNLLMDWPLPLVAVQLLWLNLVANGIQDVGLAFEQGETGVMNEAPRPPQEGIFNRPMLEKVVVGAAAQALISIVFWYWVSGQNYSIEEKRNFMLMLLIFIGNLQVLTCRSERKSMFAMPISRNRLLIIGIVFTNALHYFATQNPFLQSVLSLTPLSLDKWALLLVAALPIVAVMELQKSMRRKI